MTAEDRTNVGQPTQTAGNRYPEPGEALACVQRNGGVHRWGSATEFEYVPGEVVYGVDCEDCRMPATGVTLEGAMDAAQAIDRLDRALIEPVNEAEAER